MSYKFFDDCVHDYDSDYDYSGDYNGDSRCSLRLNSTEPNPRVSTGSTVEDSRMLRTIFLHVRSEQRLITCGCVSLRRGRTPLRREMTASYSSAILLQLRLGVVQMSQCVFVVSYSDLIQYFSRSYDRIVSNRREVILNPDSSHGSKWSTCKVSIGALGRGYKYVSLLYLSGAIRHYARVSFLIRYNMRRYVIRYPRTDRINAKPGTR